MSKHFSIFQTDAQFTAAADTLDYPHVSLIETTGDLKYAVYNGKQLADAPFGSILIYDVNNNNHFYVETYDSTELPTSDFKPIGVCIYDKASNSENVPVFMIRGNDSIAPMWFPNRTQVKFSKSAISDDFKEYVAKDKNKSSREINAYFRDYEFESLNEYVMRNYNGTDQTIFNEITQSNYPGIYSALYATGYGFSKGDLLLASYHDISKAFDTDAENQAIIGTAFESIGVTPNFGFFTCTSYYNSSSSSWKSYVYSFNEYGNNFKNSKQSVPYKGVTASGNSNAYAGLVYIPHVEEL